MHCPSWIFDISVARSASEYLASEMELGKLCKKICQDLSEHYDPILTEAISVTSMYVSISFRDRGQGDCN